MEDTNTSKDKKEIKSKDELINIKSDFFLQKICDYLKRNKSLEILKYNKNIQKRMNININHYKTYSEKYSSIEIEIKPIENKYGRFINLNKENEEYYHIYYNDKKMNKLKVLH